jgi:hypothetical protein
VVTVGVLLPSANSNTPIFDRPTETLDGTPVVSSAPCRATSCSSSETLAELSDEEALLVSVKRGRAAWLPGDTLTRAMDDIPVEELGDREVRLIRTARFICPNIVCPAEWRSICGTSAS